ncbi:SusD/RagB family nutrient-binding outer membrane lipoprotein [Fodinibius sediminis]|uniref:Susd and RagB outer membrane lipoprotein n=1 Tax=Fodinibius sediminis TaxID=1214077 RepID=A0A521AMZ6_9BACT|nr:SusD/RagB family nutrient-binding outer membrane lipoprotein [Fodinibius sediminis]SMO36188.1 Susd and RagB outer membrane lipoprotein [Fodinibius sediminis]
MKKLRLLPIFLCILSVTITSCDSVDFGGLNQDDDVPTEANMEGLMAGGMNQFFTNWGRAYFNNPTLYVQYQAQSTYTTEMTYGENPYPWSLYYSGVLSNFKEIYQRTTAEEIPTTVSGFGDPANQAAVAEIMSAVVFKRVTDIWGPVPYSNGDGTVGQGLAGLDNVTPTYTSQDSIYKNLITRVKAARDMINVGAAGPTGDVLYGGDMEKWQQFANSLILQLAIQLSDVDEAYAQQEFNAALDHEAEVIKTVDAEAWYDYRNSPGAINPLSQNRASDYLLSDSFTDALQGDTNGDSTIVYSNTRMDERLNVFATDPTISGGRFGIDKISNSGSSISDQIWDAGADLPYMTAAYTYLNRAEAANLGWTNESAALMLEEAITMSYASIDAHWDDGDASSGLLTTDGTAFAVQRVADASNGNAEDGLAQVIAEEKWVALFPMGFDAWSEWRRTSDDKNWGADHGRTYDAKGYPGLYPAVDATNGGEIPTRYIYPSAEAGTNSSGYDSGVSQLTPSQDNNTSNMWWDIGDQ